MRTSLRSVVFCLTLIGSGVSGADLGTAFTFQGWLERPAGTPMGSPTPISCDFRLGLWDAASGGDQEGNSPQTKSGVGVSDGVFTIADLDFGPAAINGTARWLAIEVQCPGDAGFVLLTPRVALTPAPHALALPGIYTDSSLGEPRVYVEPRSDCCIAHAYPLGCSVPSCQTAVCAVDSLCCDTAWEATCAFEAASLCGTLCETGTDRPLVGIGTDSPTQVLDVDGNIRSRGGDIMLNGRGGGDSNNGGAGRALVDCGDGTQLPGCRGLIINFSNDYGIVNIAGKVIFPDNSVGIGVDPTTHPFEMASGAHCTAGGTWTNASDRDLKENFASVDTQAVLEAVATLPIGSWNYKCEEDAVRHMGPVAQDFHAAFGLGGDNRSIATIDGDGVALAAIQGLHQIVQEKDRELEAVKQRLVRLEEAFDAASRRDGDKP